MSIKSDPRRTPAPKKDQKKGSKKNKPDSAKNPSGKITFSKEVTQQLSNKAKEHNAKGKGSKATLGMLKAVYRRGAGAYSSSHAPKMSRHLTLAMFRITIFCQRDILKSPKVHICMSILRLAKFLPIVEKVSIQKMVRF